MVYRSTPEEWEAYRRQCYPFSAYINDIYGQPVTDVPENSTSNVGNMPPEDPMQHTNMNPSLPITPYFQSYQSAAPTLGSPWSMEPSPESYQSAVITNSSPWSLVPDANNCYAPLSEPATSLSSAQAVALMPTNPAYQGGSQPALWQEAFPLEDVPPEPAIIQPDELMEPRYDWLHDAEGRRHWNTQINSLYAIISDPSTNNQTRLEARNKLLELTNILRKRSEQHDTVREQIRGTYAQAPRLWVALQTRERERTSEKGEAEMFFLQSFFASRDPVVLKKFLSALERREKTYTGGWWPYRAIRELSEMSQQQSAPQDHVN